MRLAIRRVAACPSTNDLAKDLARSGAEEGTVVVAGEQTAGRGTKGRTWHSPAGRGLYVSIVLRPPAVVLPLLPLAAGLAARDAVEAVAGLAAGLRWPNDLVWRGMKLGGVLCESAHAGERVEFTIVGVGINAGQAAEDFPPDIRGSAVSVSVAAGRAVGPEALLEPFLAAFQARYEALLAGREAEIVRDFERHSAFARGERITVMMGPGGGPGDAVAGGFAGIAGDGALLLLTEAGLRRFVWGEISRVATPSR